MSGAWSLLKQIGVKKYEQLKDSYEKIGAVRKDKDFPLGIRFNGILEIPEVDFILGGIDLKIKRPDSAEVVTSYGTFTVGGSTVHRFYMLSSETIYLLQIVSDARQTIEECKFFMAYDEIYPEDWDFWLSEKDGYIGLGIFQTKDGTQYFRVWENQDAESVVEEDDPGNRLTRIPPVQFIETIYMDPYGEKTETVKYDSMLYGRRVNDAVDEYLLLSAVNETSGASVQIMVGIELEQASIKVI
ncbi:MAG: DUF2491 family protein [Desulfomonile sp.]|jgi:hypothetical protein|nr:DUF2491 family protein [Deltaproteobacteria bacterium]